MTKKINSRTVLVTGITGDIGKAVAVRFAQEGWNIIGHYNSDQGKTALIKSEIKKYSVECDFIKADFTSERQVSKMIKVVSKLRIDSLVNNAGTYIKKMGFNDLSVSDLTQVFTLNVFSPMILTTKVFEQMRANKFGRIVNISSIAAKYGGSEVSMHYGCAKRAIEGVTKTLARMGAGNNVLVNTVRPGIIDTDFHKKFSKNMDKRISLVPMKRMGTVQEVADLVFYLGSDDNTYLTNEIVTIAGGE